MSVKVGQEAPDFELPNTEGGTTKLSDFRGNKSVLLVFYPFAFSGRCHTEFCTLRDENADLVSTDDVEILGISIDHVFALKAWKEKENFPNTFLADFWPHGAVADRYGAFNDRGFCNRMTFLIDKEGIVRFVEDNPSNDVRDQSGWRKALAEAN
ncbi:MAG: peroxiredoxin [Actinomycetota bacterium]